MKRIAIVVQRCHESVVGGSEALAWQYAQLLSGDYAIEVLTSTSIDHTRWDNILQPGTDRRAQVTIRRFPVAITRQPYWDGLYHRLYESDAMRGRAAGWSEALQDEFIRWQGPFCPELEHWLRTRGSDYACVLFVTYLYPTTYFGIRAVAARRVILIPTLHDELPARLAVFSRLYARYKQRIWLTHAEQRTAASLWGFDEGEVLGMAVTHTESVTPETRTRPYLLYCGRIEAGKGCDELLHAFERLPSRGRVSLVFTGVDNMGLPRSPDIEYLGFVSEERKLALMAGAIGFVLPSRHESFSIVTLEAMAQRTPVLVNASCEVMREHIECSGGGFHYASTEDMVGKMQHLCMLDAGERRRLGDAGRGYVLANYAEACMRDRLIGYVARVIERDERTRC